MPIFHKDIEVTVLSINSFSHIISFGKLAFYLFLLFTWCQVNFIELFASGMFSTKSWKTSCFPVF